MPRQELIQELKIREKELMDELEAIQRILKSNIIGSSISTNQDVQPSNVEVSGNIKGKRSWEDYIVDVLKEIGGKAKSVDVTEAIIKANADMSEDTISHAVRHHLSKLLKNEKIGANKTKIKSEGYEYFIK